MISRHLEQTILSKIETGKAIILLGPRQTGKTTLLQKIALQLGDYLLLDCDDPVVREQLENINTAELKQLIGNYKIVFIDEAQRVKNIGITLKIITDRLKNVQLLVSGSSSLDLVSEISEPLTGRKWEYMLYPISWSEFHEHAGHLTALQQLELRMIYGMYPEVINNPGSEKEILKQLTGSYLYKDLLSYKGIHIPELPEKLLRAVALQLGNEVSYNELSGLLKVDKNTVNTYLNLLEKAFIIFRLHPFSRNLRNEISTSRKIYFFDTGIRNALIANFNPLTLRQDTGALWENFLIAERMKLFHYEGIWANSFFWRTKQQQEIDYLEEYGGKLYAFEFKWSTHKKVKISKTFSSAYPGSEIQIITRENYNDFLLPGRHSIKT
jgi:predicted AAA+ superfamily ATPase